ncbi:MAG: sigma-70 family RNA polymerase sigma factor [Armatimonadetes bacterium]|nr:sigma-70 family RNA polymerase sigma factor [Armatimonadota bacterium]MBX3108121.1 sigma-70 family RNA polymerase sigma factor [Fimbriimonadaceae bacterium]
MTLDGPDFRETHAQIAAALVRRFGPHCLEPALDAVQEAFVAALQSWPMQGQPSNPKAWLHKAAERRLIDQLRKTRRETAWPSQDLVAEGTAPDDELALYFMVCSPKLKMGEQVCLILRTLGGLTAAEIAGLFHESEEAVQRRISRAKSKLDPQDLEPADPATAMPSVLLALYLMFTEGYEAQRGQYYLRPELAAEALRLTDILAGHAGGRFPDLYALSALMHFHSSRIKARLDAHGLPILFADQDPALIDRSHIGAGFAALEQAQAAPRLSRYHVEAGLAAAVAAGARSHEILRWHELLVESFPTPMARLAHAVAVGTCRGPKAGLAALAALKRDPRIVRTPQYHAAIGHFCALDGDRVAGAAAYRRAVGLSMSNPIRQSLEQRAEELSNSGQ